MQRFIAAVLVMGSLVGCGGTELDVPQQDAATSVSEGALAQPAPVESLIYDCGDPMFLEQCSPEGKVVVCNPYPIRLPFRCTCRDGWWNCVEVR